MNYTNINPDGRNKIIAGAVRAAKAVCSSHGPGKRTVAIDKLAFDPNTGEWYTHYSFPSSDGRMIASNIRLEDREENLGASWLIDQAIRTEKEAGDGTTWTCAIAGGILANFDHKYDRRKISEELSAVSGIVMENLRAMSKKVETLEELKKVATISANNNPALGELIAGIVWEVGEHGTVYVKNGDSHETTTELKKGYVMHKALMSEQYMKSRPLDGFTYFAPVVALVHDTIENVKELNSLVSKFESLHAKSVNGRIVYDRELVIFSRGMSNDCLNSMVGEYLRGKPIVVVSVRGIWSLDVFKDLAAMTGAEIWSETEGRPINRFPKTGYDKEKLTEGFGTAEKIHFDGTQVTLFLKKISEDKESPLDAHIAIVSEQSFFGSEQANYPAEAQNVLRERESLRKERVSKMTRGIGYINIGGSADAEMANIGQLVDDAQLACFSALRHGYLPGGAYALINACQFLPNTYGAKLFTDAVVGAYCNMLANSGFNNPQTNYCKDDHVFNLVTGEFEKISETTVYDAAKAVECAVRNGISVASVIIETQYSVVWAIQQK